MMAILAPLLMGCSSSTSKTYKKVEADTPAQVENKDDLVGDKNGAEEALYLIKAMCEGPGKLPPNIQLPCVGKDCPSAGLPDDGKISVLCKAEAVAYYAKPEVDKLPLPRAMTVDTAVIVDGKVLLETHGAAADVKSTAIACQTVTKMSEQKEMMAIATCEDFEKIETLEDLNEWCLAQIANEESTPEPTPKLSVTRTKIGNVSTCITPTPCEGSECGPDICQGLEDCEAVRPIPILPPDDGDGE